ncbi:MAG: GGDEF domain-containing protein [Pseudomonadota bacterium]|nr:GGDEF domain-containing protein [Pseudomonadota bacterium]
MRYQHNVSQSGDILRKVLPVMAHHAAPYHPVSYAVWYEHLAGINPALTAEVEQRKGAQAAIDDQVVRELYRAHILDAASRGTLGVNSEIESMLDAVDGDAHRIAAGALRFEQDWPHLAGLLEALVGQPPQGAIDQAIVTGSQVAGTVDRLRLDLAASVALAHRLRVRLSELQTQVLTDALTGLLNRRGLEEHWQRLDAAAEAGGPGARCAVVVIDVDHFKQVNDRFGHAFGDAVLRAVAQVLLRAVAGGGLAARMGGEEFLLLLPDHDRARAADLAEAVRALMERHDVRDKASGVAAAKVTISCGVASRQPDESMDALLARADAAMYRAKRGGRNAVALA